MEGRVGKALAGLWRDIVRYKNVGIVLVLYYIVSHFLFGAFCPSVVVTGFPCPGCGLTRAALFTVTGQWTRAWNINPLIFGWLFFVLYAMWRRYWMGQEVKGWKKITIFLCLLMIAVFALRMYFYFPSRPPMSYTGGNLFEKIVPNYGETIKKLIY